jgi:hypothetical protein
MSREPQWIRRVERGRERHRRRVQAARLTPSRARMILAGTRSGPADWGTKVEGISEISRRTKSPSVHRAEVNRSSTALAKLVDGRSKNTREREGGKQYRLQHHSIPDSPEIQLPKWPMRKLSWKSLRAEERIRPMRGTGKNLADLQKYRDSINVTWYSEAFL